MRHHLAIALWLAAVALVAWACGSDDSTTTSDDSAGAAGRIAPPSAAGGHDSAAGAGGAHSFTPTSGELLPSVTLAGAAGEPSTSQSAAGQCRVAEANALPWRTNTTQGAASGTAQVSIFVQDLFDTFKSHCGSCHVEADLGNFNVSQNTFATRVDRNAIDRILSPDPKRVMPPRSAGGKVPAERSPEDPMFAFVERLKLWIEAGRPRDVFQVASKDTTAMSQSANYRLSSVQAAAMTNIGDCIPAPAIVATENGKMLELDQLFAGLVRQPSGQGTVLARIGLPEHLRDTDLFTFDAEVLARHGVIAYSPAYPLWTDDAGKLRHVRVPLGQSIRFDPGTRQFTMPANTRFYKTFFREVIEPDGVKRNRKIETRVLVARHDTKLSDGSITPMALFGTYVWNEDETDAVLLTDPLRNGEPFRDRLITVVTDEVKAQAVRATNPTNLAFALEDVGAMRRYAIPGSDRCIHCHMGSPSGNFVLGFLPLQMQHRPLGQGGTIEPSGPDEQTQLQRLVSYGLLSGVPEDPANWPRLEEPQGARGPRNGEELVAQGYLLGNCAHCHNPRGFASVENSVMRDVLDFLPSESGGIFQFPLERTSPRIFRGKSGNVPIPYVTPSLVDLPVTDGSTGVFYTPKADFTGTWTASPLAVDESRTGLPPGSSVPRGIVFAPWRSLIYRNVDSPFTYSDHFALYPHMPMDSPGNDCRAHRILGDWMVSIPARRKHPEIWEYSGAPTDGGPCQFGGQARCDDEPQPYMEVKPGDPDFAAVQQDATLRLAKFHGGTPDWFRPWAGSLYSRYDYCPDQRDIVDRSLGVGSSSCNSKVSPSSGQISSTVAGVPTVTMPDLGIPLRPHFVVTDVTDPLGEYYPRRTDWQSVLVQQQFTPITGSGCSTDQSRQADEKHVVEMLATVTSSAELRNFATTEVPFGLWKPNAACDLSSVRTADTYAGVERPKWMDFPSSGVTPGSRVYSEAPGAMVFKLICSNCHGSRADSRGRLSENLQTMTGGTVRVANLRDGLFGPPSAPGGNVDGVFSGTASQLGITPDDLGARYLTWMALGGTKARIPPSILNIVGNTQVLGIARNGTAFQSVTAQNANMLSTAQELCRHTLPWQPGRTTVAFEPSRGSFSMRNSALIAENGDAEMWQALCSLGNPPPIRAVVGEGWATDSPSFSIVPMAGLYRAAGYPPMTPVGDHRGQIRAALDPDNWLPWCLVKPSDSTAATQAEAYVANHLISGSPMQFCPPQLLTEEFRLRQDMSGASGDRRDLDDWAARGAINAGIAVFQYLKQAATKPGWSLKPSNDRCDLLSR